MGIFTNMSRPVRWLFGIVGFFVFGWLLMYWGLTSTVGQNDSILEEARADYSGYVASALQSYFEKNAQYPRELDELSLPEDALPSNKEAQFLYDGLPYPGNEKGPFCSYKLKISYPSFLGESGGEDDIASGKTANVDQCGSSAFQPVKEKHEALVAETIKEINADFERLQTILDDYKTQNGYYPVSINFLLVEDETLIKNAVSPDEKYSYTAYAAGEIVISEDDIKSTKACGYVLMAHHFNSELLEEPIEVGRGNNGNCARELR